MFQKYYKPDNLLEALAILDGYGRRARIIAGGTDLVVQMHKGEICCDAVVDITAIKELRYIDEENGKIKIGALVTHTELSESKVLRQKASLLSEAARSVGSLQIRNAGTIGGNIINAQPAADTALPLMALDAKVKIASPKGIKQLEFNQIYQPTGGTAIDATSEILTEISFYPPVNIGGCGAFSRVARRKALSLPVFNAAVVILLSDDKNTIKDSRIVLGPMDRVPFRAKFAENILLNKLPSETIFRQAADMSATESKPRDSVFRGSAAYRKQLARVIVFNTLLKAWNNIVC